jgi:glyoxylase-like metal-dependent hydrolase (beta-lactamase superfamily II)
LLLRDDDPARPPKEETFQDRRTLEIGGERIDLAWHEANHSPDNIIIHLPDHDTLMLIDIVNPGWVPVYVSNLTEDIPGYLEAQAKAIDAVDPRRYYAHYHDNREQVGRSQGPPRRNLAPRAEPVIEKYTGVVAGADIFTDITAFRVMESIRIDLGFASQVHP